MKKTFSIAVLINLVAVFLLLVIMIGSCLTGCQSNTVFAPVLLERQTAQDIHSKNTAAIQPLASIANPAVKEEKTISSQYNIPDRYTAKFTAANGWLKVNVDADIDLPEVDKVPVATMEPADFSQEIVSLMFERLCGGYEMYDPITSVRNTGKLETKQQTSTIDGEKISYDITGTSAMTKDKKRSFFVANNAMKKELITIRGATMTFMTDRALHNFSSFPLRRILGDTVVPKEAKGKLTITPMKAREQVEALIKGTGLVLIDMYLVDDVNVRLDGESKSKSANRYAYRVFCGPAVNGVSTSAITGSASVPMGAFQNKLWLYESMEIFIDDKGIFLLYWNSPHKVSSVTETDAKLLAFSEIKRIFQDSVDKQYGNLKNQYSMVSSVELQVDLVTLSLQRVLENDSIDQGRFIPVWNFFGTETRNEKNGASHKTSKHAGSLEGSLLCINAMDGSIIDTMKGK